MSTVPHACADAGKRETDGEVESFAGGFAMIAGNVALSRRSAGVPGRRRRWSVVEDRRHRDGDGRCNCGWW